MAGSVPVRWWVGALTMAMLWGIAPSVAQETTELEASPDPIQQVVDAGLMTRYADGSFREMEILTRAQLASILVRTFQLDQRSPAQAAIITLQDVPASHWAAQAIQTALQNGLMTGYREGRFFPEQRVTRGEAFAILAQAYGVFQFDDESIARILAAYPDAAAIPSWARRSIATSLYEGFVNIDLSTNQIYPQRPMTRGDMAYALSQYLVRQEAPADIPWIPTAE